MLNQKLLSATPALRFKLLCLLAVCVMLQGCAKPTQQYERPTLPANLSAPCPEVPLVDSPSWDDLGRAHIKLALMYSQCAAKHDAIVRSWSQ